MEFQEQLEHGELAKIRAGLVLEKLKRKARRKRRKRELVDVDSGFVEEEDLEELKTHVAGAGAWAKIEPGCVKLVKRGVAPH